MFSDPKLSGNSLQGGKIAPLLLILELWARSLLIFPGLLSFSTVFIESSVT